MPGIPACSAPHRKHSYRMASLQLEVSKDGKGQLEAAGQAVKGERPQLQQSIKTFLNPAPFGRNSTRGEAGHVGEPSEEKPCSTLQG